MISFARGVPAPECIPVDELADCARAAVERDGATVLSYGSAAGYRPLREWIGERHGVDPNRVLVTNGSLQGLVFLAERFAGRRVLVEAPTYDRPLKILAEKAMLDLRGPVLRVTGYDVPYPYWQIEDAYMPSVERVVDAVETLLDY